MKNKNVLTSLLLLLFTSTAAFAQTTKQTNDWYNKKEWLNGLQIQPHSSINKTEFSKQYQRNKEYWDKAFAFLKNHDLKTLAPGRYEIDGDNVYAMITDNPTKPLDSVKWESHRNYIDLQSVINGEEKIGISPISKLTVTMPYDASKDIMNYSGDGKFYLAQPGTFFLFFPSDAHRPTVATGSNKPDKKVVIKIKYAS